MNAQDVQELFDGLEKNELIGEYTHVLTGNYRLCAQQSHLFTFSWLGYIGNFAILETIQNMVRKLKAVNPDLIYRKWMCSVDWIHGPDSRTTSLRYCDGRWRRTVCCTWNCAII